MEKFTHSENALKTIDMRKIYLDHGFPYFTSARHSKLDDKPRHYGITTPIIPIHHTIIPLNHTIMTLHIALKSEIEGSVGGKAEGEHGGESEGKGKASLAVC